jgi:DNA-binding CsgD family transcriptional regulator
MTLTQSVQTGGVGGIARIPRARAESAYAVLVAPLPAGTGLTGSFETGRSGVFLLIHNPDARMPMPAEALGAAFGLTARGAELAVALAAGEDLKDYAERTGLSVHTARFHLKTAFARMNVRTQAQLVRHVVRALADFALARS